MHRIELPGRVWLEVEESKSGVFVVTKDSETSPGRSRYESTLLGFTYWDSEVENLDFGDAFDCLGISLHLRWRDVELNLEVDPPEFRAPDRECLEEALTHVTLGPWCPGDI